MSCALPIAAAVVALLPLGAIAEGVQVRTVRGGVLCATPFQLRKAIAAAHHDETQRVWQLGCMRTGQGIKATLLGETGPPYGPWRVRLLPDGAASLVMWGYASSFRSDSEETLWPLEATSLDDPY